MIELLIALLMSLQSGTTCQQGTRVEWDDYLRSHPDASIVGEVTWRGDDPFSFWLIDGTPDVDDPPVVFLFDQLNMPHGQCAVLLHDNEVSR